MRKLLGSGCFSSQEEIWLDDERSIYPDFCIFDGFIDDQGWIRLFGRFKDYSRNADGEEYLCVIYVNSWKSNTQKTPEDIETVEDAINLEWEDPQYDLYTSKEEEDFWDLLDKYIEES
jgi:hypothetical protein